MSEVTEFVLDLAKDLVGSLGPEDFATGTAQALVTNRSLAGRIDREQPYLAEFVEYLFGPENPKPVFRTEGAGAVLNNLKLPGRRHVSNYFGKMPFGYIYVYDKFVVFLSQSLLTPGELAPFFDRRTGITAMENLRLMRRFNVVPLTREALARATTPERERLRKPLANRNSIIVPASRISNAVGKRHTVGGVLHSSWIELSDDRRRILFAPTMVGFGPRFWKAMATGFGLQWEPKLLVLLQRFAAGNSRL
jgi:hypothetical protein